MWIFSSFTEDVIDEIAKTMLSIEMGKKLWVDGVEVDPDKAEALNVYDAGHSDCELYSRRGTLVFLSPLLDEESICILNRVDKRINELQKPVDMSMANGFSCIKFPHIELNASATDVENEDIYSRRTYSSYRRNGETTSVFAWDMVDEICTCTSFRIDDWVAFRNTVVIDVRGMTRVSKHITRVSPGNIIHMLECTGKLEKKRRPPISYRYGVPYRGNRKRDIFSVHDVVSRTGEVCRNGDHNITENSSNDKELCQDCGEMLYDGNCLSISGHGDGEATDVLFMCVVCIHKLGPFVDNVRIYSGCSRAIMDVCERPVKKPDAVKDIISGFNNGTIYLDSPVKIYDGVMLIRQEEAINTSALEKIIRFIDKSGPDADVFPVYEI